MAWRGDINNPAPNPIQQSNLVESEINRDVNRAQEVRRDTDSQKNFSVGLYDVDEAILTHLNGLNLSVVDDGQIIKVPTKLGSQEIWKSAQKDGYLRDNNGNIILPMIVFKRESTEKDPSMQTFNRYLRYPTLKKYDDKNRYTPFNVLVGKNVPINDVYEVVMPDHMMFTYKFIIWTEYIQQMNRIVEAINFATEDYWGDKKRFKFRTKVDSFVHTIELEVESDRVVKTEFSMTVWGYLLPEYFDGKQTTTKKYLTPKKIVLGAEVVGTDFDFDVMRQSSLDKIRNQNYPNLPADEEIPPPPVTWGDVGGDINGSTASGVLDTLRILQDASNFLEQAGHNVGVVWQNPPVTDQDYGEEGWMAHDQNYLYVYSKTRWRRLAINIWQPPPLTADSPGQDGWMAHDKSYLYIYSRGRWRRAPINLFT